MNRRSFFKTLAGLAAATWAETVVDPVVPRLDPLLDEINRITLETIYSSGIEDLFFKGPPRLQCFRDQEVVFHG